MSIFKLKENISQISPGKISCNVSGVCSYPTPFHMRPIGEVSVPLLGLEYKLTERLFVYGNGMKCVSENSLLTTGGKYICKGFSERKMALYINEDGNPRLSDVEGISTISGEVWEVDENKIKFLMAQGDGRIMKKVWVSMADHGGKVTRECWTTLYNDVTRHYLNNEAELVSDGDWYGFKNKNMQNLLRSYGV